MVNKVILIGHVGGDPEVRHLESGVSVAKFSMATNESYKDKDGNWQDITDWHNIVVWRWLAEKAERSVKKGSFIFLEGKLTTRSWKDQDEKMRYITEVVGNSFRVLDKRDSSGTSYPMPTSMDEPEYARAGGGSSSMDDSTGSTLANSENNSSLSEEEGDDDLPF